MDGKFEIKTVLLKKPNAFEFSHSSYLVLKEFTTKGHPSEVVRKGTVLTVKKRNQQSGMVLVDSEQLTYRQWLTKEQIPFLKPIEEEPKEKKPALVKMVDLTHDSDDDITAHQIGDPFSKTFTFGTQEQLQETKKKTCKKRKKILPTPSKRPVKKQKLNTEDSNSQKEINQLREKLLIAERQRDEARKKLHAEKAAHLQSKTYFLKERKNHTAEISRLNEQLRKAQDVNKRHKNSFERKKKEYENLEAIYNEFKELKRHSLEKLSHDVQARVRNDLKEILEEKRLCSICMDRPKSVALIPCGHLLCGECSKEMKTCCFCSARLTKKVSLFADT